ncbi:hypothetical protein GGQ92_001077 [Gracilibacillus halotolerans]|uniref:Uncharacterized protein n=1 Tax=Gracilibacillus halotolerans TaxID=74386 RepID=A0A841RLF8_9BACI|nr:hypothetical protein [Gracilibacillus halotolerans]MBB6512296.1 hypothetical protein [Gracilibacillus halotolerans]
MEINEIIILYQLVIFTIIVFCSLWNKYAFGIVVVATSLWTATHVFAPWLALLQYGTIIVATIVGLILLATKRTILYVFKVSENSRKFLLPLVLIVIGAIVEVVLFNTDIYYEIPFLPSFILAMVLLSAIAVKANFIVGPVIGSFGALIISLINQELAPIITWSILIIGAVISSFIYQILPRLSINRNALRIFIAISLTEIITIVISWSYSEIWELGASYIFREILLSTVLTVLSSYLIVQLGYTIVARLSKTKL